tara:strand:+ start:457 stop:870 length:414 start_codon:yes stop_codon:yes gene_type:complete
VPKNHKKKIKKGAGFVVVRDFDGITKVLVLLSSAGKFDIPKGHVDKSDRDDFGTAQRECFEETQIFVTKSDLVCDERYVNDGLTVFLAVTTKDPELKRNPKSGKLEHKKAYWVEPEIAEFLLPAYLAGAVRSLLKLP